MAHMDPQDSQHDPEKARRAANEHSGHSIEGDTPPAEGLGVGPSNNELDVDRPGDGVKGKAALIGVVALVIVAVVLVIVGRVIGMF